MSKKKTSKTAPSFDIASFRKKRYDVVKERIRVLKLKLHQTPKRDKSIKKHLVKELTKIAYFDQKEFRLFLDKYRSFVLTTLKVDISIPLDHLISEFERICVENGTIYALKIFKDLYNIACRITTSNTFEPIPYLKANRRGEPKLFGPLLPLLYGDLQMRRAALACLQIIKLVDIQGEDFSLEGITQEGQVKRLEFDERPKVGNYFKKYIESKLPVPHGFDLKRFRECYWRALELAFPNKLTKQRLRTISKLSSIHVSARNGPNGPCLSTVVADHYALTADANNFGQLFNNVKAMAQMTSNDKLLSIIENFDDEDYKISNIKGEEAIHSKISLKREPWGRLRPFAICDYFSQSSLKGFHTYLFSWLESQPEDGTFKQDACSEAVRKWTEPGDGKPSVESADLSEATNAIPLEVQAEIVGFIAGSDFAKVWMNIASNRSFKTPDGNYITYGRGQPMGLLSSWAMLAVWHHIMVRSCLIYLEDAYTPSQTSYYVIGDDVAMLGTDLFHIYEIVVGTVQGVGISKQKGYHKETQSDYNPLQPGSGSISTAELAKRIFCNGQEITIIPPDEVKTCLEKPVQFPELLKSLRTRQYTGFDEVLEVPSLTARSRDPKSALLLSTFPLGPAPIKGNGIALAEIDPYSKLPWFQPWFNEDRFKSIYADTIRGTFVRTLLSVVTAINQWIVVATTDGEVKVKAWCYTCETQGLVLYLIGSHCKGLLDGALSDEWYDEVFPQGQPVNWSSLQKYIRAFQTVFEIDLLYKEKNPLKDTDRGRFQGTLLWKALKSALTEAQNSAKS